MKEKKKSAVVLIIGLVILAVIIYLFNFLFKIPSVGYYIAQLKGYYKNQECELAGGEAISTWNDYRACSPLEVMGVVNDRITYDGYVLCCRKNPLFPRPMPPSGSDRFYR